MVHLFLGDFFPALKLFVSPKESLGGLSHSQNTFFFKCQYNPKYKTYDRKKYSRKPVTFRGGWGGWLPSLKNMASEFQNKLCISHIQKTLLPWEPKCQPCT